MLVGLCKINTAKLGPLKSDLTQEFKSFVRTNTLICILKIMILYMMYINNDNINFYLQNAVLVKKMKKEIFSSDEVRH